MSTKKKTLPRALVSAIDAAYATKYPTAASRAYVRGFRGQRRREATIEFVPR